MNYTTTNFSSTISSLARRKSEFIQAFGEIKRPTLNRPPIYSKTFSHIEHPRSAVLAVILEYYNLDLSDSKLSRDFNFFRRTFNGDIEIGFRDGTKIVEQGDRIVTSQPTSIPDEDRATLIVSLVKAKGWQGMSVSGTDSYVQAVWAECLKQGLSVYPKPSQMKLWSKFSTASHPGENSKNAEKTEPIVQNKLLKVRGDN